MTAENFVYWLNGFMEIQNPEFITKAQIEEIRNHIALVLKKETKNLGFYGKPFGQSINVNFPTPPASC